MIGVVSREYIPKGTRFGPLVGESYTAENVPKDANRKYFWRVSCFFFFFRSFTFSKGGANEIQEREKKHTHTSEQVTSCSTDLLPAWHDGCTAYVTAEHAYKKKKC